MTRYGNGVSFFAQHQSIGFYFWILSDFKPLIFSLCEEKIQSDGRVIMSDYLGSKL